MEQLQTGTVEEVHCNDEADVIHYLSHNNSVSNDELVIIADIRKAFLQIGLHPEERNCTRFLWITNLGEEVLEENIKSYRFEQVTFGVISSPFALAAILK
ncbi:Pao retrotransposon peptidase family protein [Dirofilaria immitis]|nr:Pao retrotransposon peptidase family protein [Dirofilaria immitis]